MTKTIQYIEVDIDYCSRSYGVGACTAAIGVTGTRKCFNTFKTCQDQANFDNVPRTVRFAEATEYLPGDIDCFPSIDSISYTPQKIDPGKSMGERASIAITLQDHPDSDTFLDKYVAERDYDPFTRGTFFGKWRARNPYIKGRPLRYITGLQGEALADMQTRHFIVETTDGPSTDSKFKITAKDCLKVADGDRAQAPKKSNGYLYLAISDSETSATLEPAGIGNLEYPASGHLAIGEEIVAFTRSGDTLTLTRGQKGTTAEEHDDGDLCQLVLSYVGEKPSYIINDLLVNYTDADPDWIPITEWDNEVDQYINRVYTADIAKPTAVVDLINELIEQVGLVFWWDDDTNQIKLRTLRPVVPGDELVTDHSLIGGTLRVTDQPSKRVSQVWTSFAQLNPLEDLDRQANFGSGVVTIDAQSEIDHGMPAIYKINSRWLAAGNRSGASRLNAQILSRYRDPPRSFQFSVDRFQNTLRLGRGFNLQSWCLQDDTGDTATVPCIVTALTPSFDRYQVEAEEMLFNYRDDLEAVRLVVIDQNSSNVILRSMHDAIYEEPDGTETVVFIIESGVIVGGKVPFPSLMVGDWPAGTTLYLWNFGSILGRGGDGGTYGSPNGKQGASGVYARRPIGILNNGVIAGGGGGGGAGIHTWDGKTLEWIGGGGGAGASPSNNGGSQRGRCDQYYQENTTPTITVSGNNGYGQGQLSGSGNDFRIYPGRGGSRALPGTDGYWNLQSESSATKRNTASGGAAGYAVDGDSYITWAGTGTITGSQVN